MSLFTKQTLHTREDNSIYMLDEIEFSLQEGKVNELIELFNSLTETLAKYDDTRERALKPEYLKGVLLGGFSFIEESRANEIYEAMKNFPLGERAKSRLVAETLDEINGQLRSDLELYESKLSFIRKNMRKGLSIDDDLVIVVGEDKCTVTIRENFIDELRTEMSREISHRELKDNETFRKAIKLLWSLADKGYYLQDGTYISREGHPISMPSVIDKLMRSDVINNIKEREKLITDENLFNTLVIRNR